MTCNCAAPLYHHAKCTTLAADGLSLCAPCLLCWNLAGACTPPYVPSPVVPLPVPSIPLKPADVEAAITAAAEEALGI